MKKIHEKKKNDKKKIKNKKKTFSQKWPIFKKYPIFTGPDLKGARRTVLSAQRARRSKSRGPKGLQLEVGAQRAHISTHLLKYVNNKSITESLDQCNSSETNERHTAMPSQQNVITRINHDVRCVDSQRS